MERVSVIVPTTASSVRTGPLRQALESLLNQERARAVPIVVVNGTRYHGPMLSALQNDRRVKCIYREQPGLPEALAEGRRTVDTEFFSVLDDDDLYLPDALSIRLEAAARRSDVNVVVSNGYESIGGKRILKIASLKEAEADPAGFLMKYNWLASAAGLFRTDNVPAALFSEMPQGVEWTYLGLRLSLAGTLEFIDHPTYVINVGSPESISASSRYPELQPPALRKMMNLPVSKAVHGALRRKLAAALHDLAEHARAGGTLADAWKYHIASLMEGGGLRYVSYTRKLLFQKF